MFAPGAGNRKRRLRKVPDETSLFVPRCAASECDTRFDPGENAG